MSASSGAVRDNGSTVRIGVGADPVVWTNIPGIDEVDFPDQTRPNLDVTHLESPGDTEETIRGMKPVAEWSKTMHYVEGSDADVALVALDASGDTFIMEFKPGAGAARQYSAYVNGYVPSGINPKGVMMAKLTVTIQAEIVS